jgi:hypothetical protein
MSENKQTLLEANMLDKPRKLEMLELALLDNGKNEVEKLLHISRLKAFNDRELEQGCRGWCISSDIVDIVDLADGSKLFKKKVLAVFTPTNQPALLNVAMEKSTIATPKRTEAEQTALLAELLGPQPQATPVPSAPPAMTDKPSALTAPSAKLLAFEVGEFSDVGLSQTDYLNTTLMNKLVVFNQETADAFKQVIMSQPIPKWSTPGSHEHYVAIATVNELVSAMKRFIFNIFHDERPVEAHAQAELYLSQFNAIANDLNQHVIDFTNFAPYIADGADDRLILYSAPYGTHDSKQKYSQLARPLDYPNLSKYRSKHRDTFPTDFTKATDYLKQIYTLLGAN